MRLTSTIRRISTVGLVALAVGCSASNHANTSTAHSPTTTTASIPAGTVRQPDAVTLPPLPGGHIGSGSHGAVVLAYQRRLRQLHLDPGPLDGVYSQDTTYAVVAAEKALGLERDGVIGPAVKHGLEHFTYRVGLADAEADRVEINLDTQLLTVYRNWQPTLLTTTSTGSGAYFCGGSDGCQYAITPAGHFHLQYRHTGWETGKLGRMWNPYYFNGGIAIHGLQSVPNYPGSHGSRADPDVYRDVLSYSRHEGRVRLRHRHGHETRRSLCRPDHDDLDDQHHHDFDYFHDDDDIDDHSAGFDNRAAHDNDDRAPLPVDDNDAAQAEVIKQFGSFS